MDSAQLALPVELRVAPDPVRPLAAVWYIDAGRGGVHPPLLATSEEHTMFFALAVILVLAWLLGFGVFHVAGSLIHLLLVLAVISILWRFIGGRRTVV
jgi:hypothetical protein